MIGRVGVVQGAQRLRPVIGQDLEPRQLHVPVGAQRERLQPGEGQHVGHLATAWAGAEQDELVRASLQPNLEAWLMPLT